MTPAQLRAFAAIARNGTSKAAAAELGVSEAAVSGHVAALRKELGDALFQRTGTGIALTPGGMRLASRAVEMLGLQEQTRYEVRAAANSERVLRLAVSSLFAEYAAPGMIELFSTRAEDLSVEMSVFPPDQFARLLTARAIDAAIGPAPTAATEGISTVPFMRYQLAAVVGADHDVAGRRVTAAEVGAQTWLLGPSAVDVDSGAFRMLRHYAVAEANQRIYQNHAAALSDVRSGAGVALCPMNSLKTEAADGRLVRVDAPGSTVDGTWASSVLERYGPGALADELVRFLSTPRAIQAMLSGSAANITKFRPRVHVTLWS